jgi:ferredoxin/protein involved in ribonucleotide reduction
MKILYFSATGNCLYVAKKIGGELLSIPQLNKNNVYEINDDIVGIIIPVYMWDIPRPVKKYLAKVKIKADYIFVLMTYGSVQVGAIGLMKKLLEENNVQVNYSNIIKMVDNYLPVFEMAKQLKIKNDDDIDSKINTIIADIENKKHFIIKPLFFQILLSKIYSSLYLTDKFMKKAVKQFYLNDTCDGCNICRKVCPTGNIIGAGIPIYLNKCEFCLSCIHNCPKNAIHLKNERSGKRFKNKNIKLVEIINSNNQM